MVTVENELNLYTIDKHTAESHSADYSARGLTLPQQAAVQAAVRMHPMASSKFIHKKKTAFEGQDQPVRSASHRYDLCNDLA